MSDVNRDKMIEIQKLKQSEEKSEKMLADFAKEVDKLAISKGELEMKSEE